MAKTKKKKKPGLFHMFHHGNLAFPIPQREVARTEILTRQKRRHSDGFDEAVSKLEAEISAMSGDDGLSVDSWAKAKPIVKGRVLASMGILLTFGVSRYPVSDEEEAAARALADDVNPTKDAA